MQARKDPAHGARQIDVTQELPTRSTEHLGACENIGIHFAHALIDIEKDNEEDEREAERDLGGRPESEPHGENRRKDDAGHGIETLDEGVRHGCRHRREREPETDGEPRNRADHKGHDGFIKRNAEVAVDFAARKPLPNTLKNDHRFAEKEGGLTVVGEEKRRNKPGLCHRPPKDEDRCEEPPLPNSNLKTFALHDVSPSL